MDLKVREAVERDYTEINNLVVEVHNLHVENRSDVYINVDTPLRREHFDDFCVKSSHQKKGIGRVLFQHIVEYSKTEGASSLQLVVWEFNKDAIKFYETLGMSTRNRRMELNLY
jgi:ribosomal protein S18 acetylase RimI-like enzyme